MAAYEWETLKEEMGNFVVQPFVMCGDGDLPDIAREPCEVEVIGLDILVYLLV